MSAHAAQPGTRPDASMLIDVDALLAAYHDVAPRSGGPGAAGLLRHLAATAARARGHVQRGARARHQRGHLPTTAASQGIDGPLFLGTRHARPVRAGRAQRAGGARGARGRRQGRRGRRPDPDARRLPRHPHPQPPAATAPRADGIVITPSHNPPEDGGFKYNPPSGGPADTGVTRWIEDEANQLLEGGPREVERALGGDAAATRPHDYIGAYVGDLGERDRHGRHPRTRASSLGVDPLGGASAPYWGPIAERYGLDLTVVNAGDRPHLPLRARSTTTARSAWTAPPRTPWRG